MCTIRLEGITRAIVAMWCKSQGGTVAVLNETIRRMCVSRERIEGPIYLMPAARDSSELGPHHSFSGNSVPA